MIDDYDIRSITIRSLRSSIGLLTRDTAVIFNDTIGYGLICFSITFSNRNNIRYGDVTASDQRLEEACRKAEIYDTIMSYPDGKTISIVPCPLNNCKCKF
jgi:ABC transporter ATM